MKAILVSVIIPTHNYGRFIGEAIDSVREQKIDDLEIIVVDDMSTDNTLQVLASIGDSRVKVASMRERAGGPGPVRNEGLNLARGQFITFLDADDRWCHHKLEHQLTIMESEADIGAVFTNFLRFNDEGVFPKSWFEFMPELLLTPSVPTRSGIGRRIVGDPFTQFIAMSQFPTFVQTLMFRACIISGLRFPADRRVSDDLDFCMRAYQRGGVAYIPEPLVEVRRHGDNISWDIKKLERDVAETLFGLEKRIGLDNPEHLSALRRRIGRAWIDNGRLYLSQGDPWAAICCFIKGLCYPKSRLRSLKNLIAFPYSWIFRGIT